MDKKKRNIIILVILCILFVVIGVFVCIDLFSKNSSDNFIINNSENNSGDNVLFDEIYDDFDSGSEEVNQQDDVVNDNSVYVEDNATSDGVVIDNENNGDDTGITNENNNNDYDNTNYTEEDVVSYFESMEEEIDTSSSFKDKFKEYFITIVDFIFYDVEIKGYTFDELSGTAKAKIISVALKIDSKIEEYIPGYKESISSTTGMMYNDIKEKLVISYMDVSSAICKNNEEECDKVKEIFGEVKEVCKIGWEFIKGLLKSGVTKLKDWYEIYSGK